MSFKQTKKLMSEAQKTFRALKKIHEPDSNFDSVVIPLIRKVMPSLIASDIVGVQPMGKPADLMGSIHGIGITNKQFAQARKEYYDEKDKEDKE